MLEVNSDLKPSSEGLEISIVIPCLNEAETIERVIAEAKTGLTSSGLKGEIVVADNGSTDGSQALSEKAGARVVAVPLRGYGAALHFGILAAKGKWVIFGDADLSYDFKLLPRFNEFVQTSEKDLVLGSRLKGTIEPGAMPFLNRYFGTPVLNWIIRLFFGLATSDCNSGMRLIRKEFYKELPMRAPGMEWASELLIKSKIKGARYAEVPIVLRPDARNRPPHLRRWRDGWRHLKTIVLLSPNRLILVPSLALLLTGFSFFLFSSLTNISLLFLNIGTAGLALGMLVKLVLHSDQVRTSRTVDYLTQKPFAEVLLGSGVLLTVFGSGLIFFNALAQFGLLLATLGALCILTSFAWGVLVTHCLKTLEK